MYRALNKPEKIGNLQLTERDKTLIRAAHAFRFFTTDQAQSMTQSKSRDKLNKRLAELWAHDYLDRPEVQRTVFAYRQKRHVVHALGQRGAKWLATNDGVHFPKGKGWKTANQLKSGERLEHRIGVTDTMLRFRQAVAAVSGLRMIYADELWATARPSSSKQKPHRLPTEITTREGVRRTRATDPDYAFGLGKLVDREEKRALFFLEWDNSTEDYVKSNPMESAILQKHLAYADVHRRKLHRDLYAFNNFRTLFVVNGEDAGERIEKMKHVFRRRVAEFSPPGIFLYTDMDSLATNGPLADIWQTPDGKTTRLL